MSGLIIPYQGAAPVVADSAFVAPDATLIGQVSVGPGTGVWYKCVIRGDMEAISIGAGCNIQDGTVIHVAGGQYDTNIGDDVSIGHMALIHACTLESGSFVGMRAAVMDGAVVETGAMVAAGALVTPGKRVPKGEVWAGQPAKFMREVGEKELELFRYVLAEYKALAQLHNTANDEAGTSVTTALRAAGSAD